MFSSKYAYVNTTKIAQIYFEIVKQDAYDYEKYDERERARKSLMAKIRRGKLNQQAWEKAKAKYLELVANDLKMMEP